MERLYRYRSELQADLFWAEKQNTSSWGQRMSDHDDEFEALGGVDIKTEIRLTLLIALCCVGLLLAVRLAAHLIA